MAVGLERDCNAATTAPSRINCEAWYQSMTGYRLDEARKKVTLALDTHPDRAEFLDTLAVILEAKGDVSGAQQASIRAAQSAPDDLYLLTQALRLNALQQPNDN